MGPISVPLESRPVNLDLTGRDTFYGVLAALRGQLCCNTDFAEPYCLDHGRTSVMPTALLLQSYDNASDAEAKARANFDLHFNLALGIEMEDRPCAKCKRQMFHAQLILHDKMCGVFEQSLRLAREAGYL